MEVEEEEEDDEAMDAAVATLRDSDTSIPDVGKIMDGNEGENHLVEAVGISE
jgi:hypothetical protein